MLTKSGTLKLTVSPKKPYIMRTSTNSYPGSLDARGTVQKKQYDVIYADPCMKRMTPKFDGNFIDTIHFAVSGHLAEARGSED